MTGRIMRSCVVGSERPLVAAANSRPFGHNGTAFSDSRLKCCMRKFNAEAIPFAEEARLRVRVGITVDPLVASAVSLEGRRA